jgi:hypothetical protein
MLGTLHKSVPNVNGFHADFERILGPSVFDEAMLRSWVQNPHRPNRFPLKKSAAQEIQQDFRRKLLKLNQAIRKKTNRPRKPPKSKSRRRGKS